MKGRLHLLQLRIRAAVIASSTMCRTVSFSSFLFSSQLNGTWLNLRHNRQLVFRHFGCRQRNSLSSSIGGQSCLKSQNGHSSRSSPAISRSFICCMCSSRSNDTSPRHCWRCMRVKVPPQSGSAKQTGRHRELPISVSTYCLTQGLQKKCMVLPLQHTILLSGMSSQQHGHSCIFPARMASLRFFSSS